MYRINQQDEKRLLDSISLNDAMEANNRLRKWGILEMLESPVQGEDSD